jgi:hypothetical protein
VDRSRMMMSDVNNGSPAVGSPYRSQIDDLFAVAYNANFDEEGNERAEEDRAALNLGRGGEEAPAPKDSGAARTPTAVEAQAGGTGTGSANPLDAASTGTSAGTGEPGVVPVPAAAGTGAEAPVEGEAKPGVGTFKSEEAVPLFAQASKQTLENMRAQFRNAAIAEVQADIDPIFIKTLGDDPFLLVGQSLPDIRPNAAKDAKYTITDTQAGRDYQAALAKLVEAEIADAASQKENEVRPMLSTVQESFLMFQNNPDLIPNTDTFDYDLAVAVADIGKSYEVKVNGKVIGYDANMQPIINKLRADISKERGANGIVTSQQTAQQLRAAEQARAANGQFDAPQAGIPSTSGTSGAGEEVENSDAFWTAVGMPGMGLRL